MDVTKEEDVKSIFNIIKDKYGGVDGLVIMQEYQE